jgi:hypothetical protein
MASLSWPKIFLDSLPWLFLGITLSTFLATETSSFARLALFILVGMSLILWVAGERILISLLIIFLGTNTLLSLFVNQVLPAWAIFPLLWLASGFTFVWLADWADKQNWAWGFAGGLFLVQTLWFLSPWPFDPKSKAALTTLFFYGFWLILPLLRESKQKRTSDWLISGIGIFLVALFILWFAEWQS